MAQVREIHIEGIIKIVWGILLTEDGLVRSGVCSVPNAFFVRLVKTGDCEP